MGQERECKSFNRPPFTNEIILAFQSSPLSQSSIQASSLHQCPVCGRIYEQDILTSLSYMVKRQKWMSAHKLNVQFIVKSLFEK